MAGRVKQSDVEELKSRADLVEIISGYVSLKPASAGSFKGLCPFHSEKSPSFNVRNSPAFYHCFGCGAGGDVFKFLQEIESISFADAVQLLADKLGYTLSFEEGQSDQSSRSRLLAANQAAANYTLKSCPRRRANSQETFWFPGGSPQILGRTSGLATHPRVGRT